MPLQKPVDRRHFTAAARAAAALGRQRRREEAKPLNAPEVFVIRQAEAQRQFGWEIRRFGAVVLDKSRTGYPTIGEAEAAGHEALVEQERAV